MKKLHLAHGLALPLDAITQTFAILAMRGVGKTYTASVFAEELSAITGKSITSSAFDGAISALRKNRLATVEHGQVRASDTLFMSALA